MDRGRAFAGPGQRALPWRPATVASSAFHESPPPDQVSASVHSHGFPATPRFSVKARPRFQPKVGANRTTSSMRPACNLCRHRPPPPPTKFSLIVPKSQMGNCLTTPGISRTYCVPPSPCHARPSSQGSPRRRVSRCGQAGIRPPPAVFDHSVPRHSMA